MKQIKCPKCNSWNSGDKVSCESCHTTLDRNIFHKEEKEKAARDRNEVYEKLKQKPNWILRFVERTEQSQNPLVKAARTGFYYLWLVYFSIVTAVLWLVFWASG